VTHHDVKYTHTLPTYVGPCPMWWWCICVRNACSRGRASRREDRLCCDTDCVVTFPCSLQLPWRTAA